MKASQYRIASRSEHTSQSRTGFGEIDGDDFVLWCLQVRSHVKRSVLIGDVGILGFEVVDELHDLQPHDKTLYTDGKESTRSIKVVQTVP